MHLLKLRYFAVLGTVEYIRWAMTSSAFTGSAGHRNAENITSVVLFKGNTHSQNHFKKKLWSSSTLLYVSMRTIKKFKRYWVLGTGKLSSWPVVHSVILYQLAMLFTGGNRRNEHYENRNETCPLIVRSGLDGFSIILVNDI